MTPSTGTAHARWLGGLAAAALAFAGAGIALASDSTDAKAKTLASIDQEIAQLRALPTYSRQ